MKRLTPETTQPFSEQVDYFEGANVENININSTPEDSVTCPKFSIAMEVYHLGFPRTVRLEMRNTLRYYLNNLGEMAMYNLCGDPHRLAIAWGEHRGKQSVVVAFGEVVTEINYESLIATDFFVESRSLYVSFPYSDLN